MENLKLQTQLNSETLERFWSKVDKTSSYTGCWIWTASKLTGGYGAFKFDGSMVRAHRFSWEIENGNVPEDLQVLHNCPGGDNPSCVNPDHLWLGTQEDNVHDMDIKCRRGDNSPINPACGERNGNSKLTKEDVEIIIHLFDNKDRFELTQQEIADLFGVSQKQISRLIHQYRNIVR